MAAMLLAGLDGIKNQIDPTTAGFGPIDVNIFSLYEEERSHIKQLPTSLGEALTALKADHKFLLAGDVFSEEMLLDWIKTKSHEERDLQLRPHPYEIELYYDL